MEVSGQHCTADPQFCWTIVTTNFVTFRLRPADSFVAFTRPASLQCYTEFLDRAPAMSAIEPFSLFEEKGAKRIQIISNDEVPKLEYNQVQILEGENGEKTIFVVNPTVDNMSAKQLLEGFNFMSVEGGGIEDGEGEHMEQENEIEEDVDPLKLSPTMLSEKDCWNWKETEMLIKIRGSKHSRMLMAPNGTKCKIWQEVAEELKERGIEKGAKACDEKWRRLKMGYYRVKDKINLGFKPRWQYYKLLDDIFQQEHHMKQSVSIDKNSKPSDHVYHKTENNDSNASTNSTSECALEETVNKTNILDDRWTYKPIISLIKYRKKYDHQFKTARPGVKTKLWRQIADHLSKGRGFNFTGDGCYDKWRSMMTRYRSLKAKKTFFPHASIKWVYFKPMEEILGADFDNYEQKRDSPKEEYHEEPVHENEINYGLQMELQEDARIQFEPKQTVDIEIQTEDSSINNSSPLDIFTATLATELLHQKRGLLDIMKEQTKSFEDRLKRLEDAEARMAEIQQEKFSRQEELIRNLGIANDLEKRKIQVLERFLENFNNPKNL
ncbi:uncharacterized protein LOC106665768 [Cimex lectularius]|uniref:Myb-like domain-containing protein n=1 Tax=Cimex lectularius TaxID=79782 RepID=A0A8I6RMB1_CIMLE|nr:uncharacterized protein LOC106665768 [Cimex lectularius]